MQKPVSVLQIQRPSMNRVTNVRSAMRVLLALVCLVGVAQLALFYQWDQSGLAGISGQTKKIQVEKEEGFSFKSITCNPMSGHCDCLAAHGLGDQCKNFDESKAMKMSIGGWLNEFPLLTGRYKCKRTECLVIADRDSEADIVAKPEMSVFPPYDNVRQHRANIRLENLKNYPDGLRSPNVDMTVTYRTDSHVQTSYIDDDISQFRTEISPFRDRKNAILWVQSNCGAEHRNNIVREMRKYYQVDSLGPCLNSNSTAVVWPECVAFERTSSTRYWEKECLLSKYKFVFALENSEDDYYTTEKLWQALKRGAVPIYWGAPNVHEYLPHSDSIIDYRTYESIPKLAEYLHLLSGNEKLYNKHLAWRKLQKFSTGFEHALENSMSNMFCRICDMAHWRQHYIDCVSKIASRAQPELSLPEIKKEESKWPFFDEVLVTHYSRKPERRDYMTNFLTRFGVSAKFITAWDRQDLSADDNKCLNPRFELATGIDNRYWWHKDLVGGEVSLSAKHFGAYHYIIENKLSNALILEDDIMIPKDLDDDAFNANLKKLMDEIPKDYDIVELGICLDMHCPVRSTGSPFSYCSHTGSRCTHAYVISFQGAIKMFKTLPLRAPIDIQTRIENYGGKWNVFWAAPGLFIQNPDIENTGIREE
eukprot:Partr_v1_DN27541_c0_g1_i1_m30618 putative (Alpha (1,3) fucosyltransferase